MGRWYELRTSKDDNGTLLVTSPKFPEVTTFGKGQREVLKHGLDAIIEAMGARIAREEPIPTPAAKSVHGKIWVEVPALIYLKVALYMVAREQGVNRAELARKLNVHREQVDRLFRLKHGSKLDFIEKAASALGVNVEVDVPKRKPKAA